MTNRTKNIVYSLVLLLAMYAIYKYRQAPKSEVIVQFSGKTMGPIAYNVTYFDSEKRNFQSSVDSILKVFNQSLNTYIPTSEISRFNRDSNFVFSLPYFKEAAIKGQEIYTLTSGAYDPSIGPLINTWGFGYKDQIAIDSTVIDSLKQFTGFDKIKITDSLITKNDYRLQLDFSASAKGYGVDVVLDLLKSRGITNAFVEIGGEVAVAGKNIQKDTLWSIGVLDPNSTELEQRYHSIISLTEKGMATSGNYFNYQIIDGVKYGHTINPNTGYPIQHELLSVTAVAENCHTADALATAFMVFGLDKTIAFLERHPEFDAFLIYSDMDGTLKSFSTPNLQPYIKQIQ
ncbi:MAG: FAD:protein FMN transferase [Bacteroidota bacterium]